MCGGTLNRFNQAVSGQSTLQMLEQINIATAFLGVSGYTDEGGFTCGKEDEMLVKRLMIQKAGKKVILMDLSLIHIWNCASRLTIMWAAYRKRSMP